MMRITSGLKLTTYLLLLSLLWVVPASASNVNIEYDPQQDRIKILASNASLTQLLAQISKQTNMEIQIDPAVEKKVNFQLPPQSLQQALQKVCKGLSYVIEYRTDKQLGTVISGMRLLPKGVQDSGQLVSVSALNAISGRSGIDANRIQINDEQESEIAQSKRRDPSSRQPRARHDQKRLGEPAKNIDHFGTGDFRSDGDSPVSIKKTKKLTAEQIREQDKTDPTSTMFGK